MDTMEQIENKFEEATVIHDDDSGDNSGDEDEEICDTCGKTIMTDDEGEKCGEGCEEYDRGLKETQEEKTQEKDQEDMQLLIYQNLCVMSLMKL